MHCISDFFSAPIGENEIWFTIKLQDSYYSLQSIIFAERQVTRGS